MDNQLLEGINQEKLAELDLYVDTMKKNRIPIRRDHLFLESNLLDVMVRVANYGADNIDDFRTVCRQSALLHRLYSGLHMLHTKKERPGTYLKTGPHAYWQISNIIRDNPGIVFEAYVRTLKKYRRQYSAANKGIVPFSQYAILAIPNSIGMLALRECAAVVILQQEPAYIEEYAIDEHRYPDLTIEEAGEAIGITKWSMLRFLNKYPRLRSSLVELGYLRIPQRSTNVHT